MMRWRWATEKFGWRAQNARRFEIHFSNLPSCSCERSFLHTTGRGTKSKTRLLLVAGWQNEFKFPSVFNRAK
jgi:hypothetical protein